jgi:hypothetical protein
MKPTAASWRREGWRAHSARKIVIASKTAIAAQRTAPLPLRALFAGWETFDVENDVVTNLSCSQ